MRFLPIKPVSMKPLIRIFLVGLLAAVSCVDPLQQENPVSGRQADLVISFGTTRSIDMTVSTKGSHNLADESKIYNFYLLIFDGNGDKIYSQYFNSKNLVSGEASILSDWWSFSQGKNDSGSIHIKTMTDKANCTIVGISNIDAEMVNISPEQLGMIGTLNDLKRMQATLIQTIVSRSGYFPMTAILKNVNTSELTSANNQTLRFERIDAKIRFEVKVDPSSNIASFTPDRWQVINVPNRSFTLLRSKTEEISSISSYDSQHPYYDAAHSESDFFNSKAVVFETDSIPNPPSGTTYTDAQKRRLMRYGFSFYMLENRKSPIGTPPSGWTYNDRDRQAKTVVNATSVVNGNFEYADPLSTYVVITGRVEIDNAPYRIGDTRTGKVLSANVRYVVHLGDFSGDHFSNFDVERNHTYTYRISILNVDDIRVEVENNVDEGSANNYDEPQTGSEGNVVVAKDSVYLCDAHYCSYVIPFHVNNIDPNHITWYVETPFNPSGRAPITVDGEEITAGIDYKWVEFRVNSADKTDDWQYDNTRQLYVPMGSEVENPLMDISDLVKYLRQQATLYYAGEESAFDHTPAAKGGPKINVTAFIDEYYYEVDPLSGKYQKDLWKKFVNTSIRQMHILSETRTSADGRSRETGSSVTIQQKSIQTIYNINKTGLTSAWGSEHTSNEVAEDKEIKKYSNTNNGYYPNTTTTRPNNNEYNGRKNTVIEWNSPTIVQDYTDSNNKRHQHMGLNGQATSWSTYINWEADNSQPLLRKSGNTNYRYLRYSCMSRNRDNDGDGFIDLDEVRWYMAATIQMIGLYLGSYGIEGDARLYQRDAVDRRSTTNNVWRQHLLTSTKYGSNSDTKARCIWAEQGVTGSDADASGTYSKISEFNTRCIRNLGYDEASGGDFTHAALESIPEEYIKMTRWKGD